MHSPDGLRVWQAAIQIAARTRLLLAHFPPRGHAELRDQITRSAESIGHNIAEGRRSVSDYKFVRYLDDAVGSASELSSQLITAMEYGIVPEREAFNLNGTVICTLRMVESLRASVQARADREARRHRKAKRRRKPDN
jgi:four helix bundle protein